MGIQVETKRGVEFFPQGEDFEITRNGDLIILGWNNPDHRFQIKAYNADWWLEVKRAE